MRSLARLWPIVLVSGLASCAFLLDFDELQSGSEDAGADVSVGGTGGTGGSGGTPTGGSAGAGGAGGTAGVAGSAGAGGDASTGVPLSEIASEIARVLCDNIAACYGPGVELITQGADCKQKFGDLFQDIFVSALEQSVSKGTVTYDALLAAACVSELEKASSEAGFKCLEIDKAAEVCKSALGMLGQKGASCAHSFECGQDLFCDTSSGCPGKCEPRFGANTSCTTTTDCDQGLTCFIPTDIEAGAPDASAVPTGTCQAFTTKGQTCDYGKLPDCEPGTLCIGGTCKAAIDLFTAGETFDCYTNGFLCKSGLACEFLGFPFLAKGKCIVPSDHTGCRHGMPNVCAANSYCTAGYLGGTGDCVGLPTKNQACATNAAQVLGLAPPCAPGLLCTQNKCQEPLRVGDACMFGDQCLSGYCKLDDADAATSDAGVPGKCAPISC